MLNKKKLPLKNLFCFLPYISTVSHGLLQINSLLNCYEIFSYTLKEIWLQSVRSTTDQAMDLHVYAEVIMFLCFFVGDGESSHRCSDDSG